MAVRPEAYTNPLLDVEGDPFAGVVNPYTSVNPAAQSGMEALRPGLADQAIGLQPPTEVSRFEMPSGLSTPPAGYGLPSLGDLEALQQQTPFEFLAATQAPQPQQQEQGLRLGYDSAAGKYLINNTVVDFRDIESLQRVPELVQEPLSPETPAGNWRPIDLQTLKRNKDELLNISIGERLRLGTQQVAGSIPRGAGRVFEFAGAEGLGEAFVGLGERLSPDEFDEARQAAVQQSQNIFQEIATGVPQGLPSVVASIGGGIAGGVAGGFITGGPGGAVIGGIIGGASTIFPMMVDSAYDTALRQQGEEFVKSPEGRVQILGTALATTGVQIVPGSIVAGRVVPTLMQRAGQQVAQKSVSSIPGEAAKLGFAEGIAEMMAVVIEQVAFDPETRAMMSEGEVAAMLPYVAETYGREAAVAFSVGAILGAPIGAVTAAATRPREEVPTAPEPESNLLVPTEDRPAAPEFTGEMRGVGPQGVLPIEGLGGQIERARRSRQVGYQPPRTGEQTNLLERPAPVVDEAQLELPLTEAAPVQQELLLTGADRLRRGIQRVPELIPPAVEPAVPAPAQGKLFTRRGLPTAAARVSTTAAEPSQIFGRVDGSPFRTEVSAVGQRRRVSRDTGIPLNELEVTQTDDGFFLRRRGEEVVREPVVEDVVTGVPEDAIQEPSPAAVPARERAEVSPEVGARVPSVAEPARAREEEIIQRTQEVRPADVRETLTPPLSPSQENILRRQRRQGLAESEAEPAANTAESEWATLKPEGAGEFISLRPALQNVWRQAFEQNVITAELAGQINRLSDTPSSVQEGLPTLVVDDTGVARIKSILESEYREATFDNDVNDLVDSLNVVRDITKPTYNRKVYENTIAELIDALYLPTGISELKTDTRVRVQKALTDLPLSNIFTKAMHIFAGNLGNPIDAQRLPFIINRIAEAGLIKDFNNRYGFINLPENLQVPVDKVPIDPATGEQISTKDVQDDALNLERNINLYNNEDFDRNPIGVQAAQRKLAELYEDVVDKGLQNFIDAKGNPLSAYFNEDGTPKIVQRDGRMRVVVDETAPARLMTTPDMLEQWDVDAVTGEATVRPADRLRRRTEGTEEEALLRSMGMDGRFMTLDGEPISKPMGEKQVRMLMNTFKNKIKIKPRTFVYKNQADFQARNPELYGRAVAARPQGDFDTKQAAGYSFGGTTDPTVVIFSDRILTRQQLNFVLAHETIGHFGMRSLLSQTRFNSVMEGLYNDSGVDTNLRFEVDAAMATDPNLSRAEAVEEYLANFAGRLDTSIVQRIFNAIKGVLNRLGVQFSDDAARYLIGHARDYVRLGEVSSMFSAADVANRIQELNGGLDPDGTGRFAASNSLGLEQMAAAFVDPPRWGNVSKALASGDHHTAAKEAIESLRKVGISAKSSSEAIKRQLWRLSTYVKRENQGLEQVFNLFNQGTKEAYKIQNDFNERLKLVFDRAMFDRVSDLPGVGGTTSTEIASINQNLYGNLMKNRNEYTPSMEGVEPLFTVLDGEYKPNTPEINRLFNLGILKFEEMRDGYSYELTDGSVIEVEGIPDLTTEDIRYRGYMDVMEALRDVHLEKVKVTMQAANVVENNVFEKLDRLMQSGELAPQQRQFLENMYRIFVQTYYSDPQFLTGEDGVLTEVENAASMQTANDFLVSLNKALIAMEAAPDAVAVERNLEVVTALRNAGQEIDATTEADIIQNIEEFKAARVSREVLNANDQQFTIQTAFKAAQTIGGEVNNAVKNAKRNIAVGYVPFVRRGTYEMAVEFFDRSGNKVFLTQEFKDAVVYRQFEGEGDAVTTTNKVNELFAGKFNRVLIKNSDEAIEAGGDPVVEADVTPRAVARKTLDTTAAPDGLDLSTVTTFLHRFSIGLPPSKMQEIIVDLTTSDAAIRNKLQAQGTPGYDPDAIRAMSEHIRKESSAIVKILMRPELNRVLDLTNEDSRKLWQGDQAKLDRLRNTFETLRDDPTASKQAKQVAQIEYRQYKYQFEKTNPPRVAGQQRRADQWKGYYGEAQTLVQFLYNNQNLNESDFGDSRYVALLRASTSIAMLGLSVATASLNFVALPTNFIPFMSSKDSDTGFGGGFNTNEVTSDLLLSMKQVGTLKARTAGYYDSLAENSEALQKSGLSVDEARFMARQVRSGVAIPAQTNQLQQAALNRVTSAFWQKFWQGYMWTFNSSERSSRRAAVLTAYRMERNRRLEAGYTTEQAQELARVFAEDAIDLTLGNYATYVRPKFFRDGPAGLLFMFSTFPHMSIQTLAHLPRNGQIKMLAALFLFTGVTGFPFAENLEDIFDTILQKLNLPIGSVRAEAAKLADAILPGSSPVVLNGLMRGLIPAEIASRTSLGRPLPGTAIGLPGSSATREAAQLLGPAFSMMQGVLATTSTLAKATYRPEVSFNDALRISPVTAFRLVGDSWSYYNTGAITDRRGYIVSPDMSAGVIISRLLGYYPSAAADQYQTIMVSRRINDYQRNVSASFRVGWIKAKMSGNESKAREIEAAVRDWNKTNKGSALEIRNFKKNAVRALREARRPALERLLRSSPPSARRELERVDDLLASDRG